MPGYPAVQHIPAILEGTRILLHTLQESHFGDLIALGRDKRIWMHYPFDLSVAGRHLRHLSEIMEQVKAGVCQAFTVFHAKHHYPVGMTRLFYLNNEHRQCETGSWLAPDFWETGMNTEAKFLLLQHCFENLQLLRVQFRTDTRNIRSRRSLEKLGAHFEGIVRKERVLENGTVRDAALYSIIDSEWPLVRADLLQKITIGREIDLPLKRHENHHFSSYVYPTNQTKLAIT